MPLDTLSGSYRSAGQLPTFAYHPHPLKTGSVVSADIECECCGRRREYRYDGPVYSTEQVDALCPWCVADGRAAKTFDAVFTDVTWRVPDDVPASVTEIIEKRTPSFASWQQQQWLHHCGDAAVFLGAVGATELVGDAEAIEALKQECREWRFADQDVEAYLASLSIDGQPTAYLFKCRHCDVHLA